MRTTITSHDEIGNLPNTYQSNDIRNIFLSPFTIGESQYTARKLTYDNGINESGEAVSFPSVSISAVSVGTSQHQINQTNEKHQPYEPTQEETANMNNIEKWISSGLAVLTAFVALGMIGCPKYKVYTQTMRGHADFAEAEVNRQIRVEEARAEEEAMMLEANGAAERELIRSQAAAQAIENVGEMLNEYPDYLRYHWINEVAGGEGERIYIPTEAGMPILEAGGSYPPSASSGGSPGAGAIDDHTDLPWRQLIPQKKFRGMSYLIRYFEL